MILKYSSSSSFQSRPLFFFLSLRTTSHVKIMFPPQTKRSRMAWSKSMTCKKFFFRGEKTAKSEKFWWCAHPPPRPVFSNFGKLQNGQKSVLPIRREESISGVKSIHSLLTEKKFFDQVTGRPGMVRENTDPKNDGFGFWHFDILTKNTSWLDDERSPNLWSKVGVRFFRVFGQVGASQVRSRPSIGMEKSLFFSRVTFFFFSHWTYFVTSRDDRIMCSYPRSSLVNTNWVEEFRTKSLYPDSHG